MTKKKTYNILRRVQSQINKICSSKAEESEPEDEEVLSDVETEVENSTVMTVEAVNVETEENNEMNTDCSNSERVVISNGDVDLTAVQNEVKSSDVASDVKGNYLFHD